MKTDIITFPDPQFETVVRKALNKPDGDITKADAEKVVSLEFGTLARVHDITGLEHFTNLTALNCSRNMGFTELDVSASTKLKVLDCSHTRLTKLNVSSNTKLEVLDCSYNRLDKLDVSANTELTVLDYSYNQSFKRGEMMTGLDVSANIKLTELKCLTGNVRNKTTLAISANTALAVLWCDGCQLLELDTSAHPALTELCCDMGALGIIRNVDMALLQLITGQERKRYVDSLIFW